MKNIGIITLLLIIIGLAAGASIYGLPDVNINLLFGLLIILFGLLYLHRMMLFRSDPKWILRYSARDPGGVSSVFLLSKMLKSPTGKKIFQNFLIPFGFVTAIGLIGLGFFFIFKG